MTPLEEKVARAIADQIGPSYDDAYEDKREWTADRGKRHDVNTPYKCDFRNAAQAAIAVVVGDVAEQMASAAARHQQCYKLAMAEGDHENERFHGTCQSTLEEAAAFIRLFYRTVPLSPTTPEGRG